MVAARARYCDPPFLGTAGYGYFKGFPYSLFLECVDYWVSIGAIVYVSEYNAYGDNWELLGEWAARRNMANKTRIDRLYRVR